MAAQTTLLWRPLPKNPVVNNLALKTTCDDENIITMKIVELGWWPKMTDFSVKMTSLLSP
jgi:hypothetical protein